MLCKSLIEILPFRTQCLRERRKARGTWDIEDFTKRSQRQVRSNFWIWSEKKRNICHPSAMILNRFIDQRRKSNVEEGGTFLLPLTHFGHSLPLMEDFILNLGRISLRVDHGDLMRGSTSNFSANRDKNEKRRRVSRITSASRNTKRSIWISHLKARSRAKRRQASTNDHWEAASIS